MPAKDIFHDNFKNALGRVLNLFQDLVPPVIFRRSRSLKRATPAHGSASESIPLLGQHSLAPDGDADS